MSPLQATHECRQQISAYSVQPFGQPAAGLVLLYRYMYNNDLMKIFTYIKHNLKKNMTNYFVTVKIYLYDMAKGQCPD